MADINSALITLREFLLSLSYDIGPPAPDFASQPFVLISRGDVTVFLSERDADRYTQTVQTLFSAVEPRETLSRNAVDSLVADTVVVLARKRAESPTAFPSAVDEAIAGLRIELHKEPSEWEFHIPVLGFAPSELPFTVGGTRFYTADETGIEQFWKRAEELIPKYRDRKPPEGVAPDFKSHFSNRFIAQVRVRAVDSKAARNRAVKEIKRTLDCINFYADREKGMGVYVLGETQQGPRLDASIRLTGETGMNLQHTLQPPWRGMPIKQIAQRPGFARMSELLAKPQPGGLDDRILTALQWAGRARIDPRPEERFLLYAVALETLLLGTRNATDLGYKLKLRCAHLVSAKDINSRKLTVKQMGGLYATRSRIVHSGRFDITDSELYLIDEYARIALFIVLTREPFTQMTTEDELENWFEAQVLGRPEQPSGV